MRTGVRYTFTDRVENVPAANSVQAKRLYMYAKDVATADVLIELVVGGIVIRSHQASWEGVIPA
jgi:hypothetical protein